MGALESREKEQAMSRKDSIQFLCGIMIDHMEFIVMALNLTGYHSKRGLVAIANRFAQKWALASTKVEVALEQKADEVIDKELIRHTRSFKKRVQNELKNKIPEAECWVNLLEHMLEELEMFEYFLSVEQPDLLYELRRWSREHAEAELFLVCQVPKLLESPSTLLDKVAVDNKILAGKLELYSENATASDHSKADFLRLSTQHETNTKTFLQDILPVLPMAELLRQGVKKMVQHELKEANWARNLILSLPNAVTTHLIN